MTELEQRVAALREVGPDYALYGVEAEIFHPPVAPAVTATGRQRFTCSCGYGTEWLPNDEMAEQGRQHLRDEHLDWEIANVWGRF